jgi:hypothetical protein
MSGCTDMSSTALNALAWRSAAKVRTSSGVARHGKAQAVSPTSTARAITEIRVGLPSIAIGHGATTTHPTDAVSAQFSTAFGIALILVHGTNRPIDYMDSDLWSAPDIASIIDRVVPYAKDFGPGTPILSAQIDIALADGRVLSRLQHGFRGHPDSAWASPRSGRMVVTECDSVVNIASGGSLDRNRATSPGIDFGSGALRRGMDFPSVCGPAVTTRSAPAA